MSDNHKTSLELRSLVSPDGVLRLSLVRAPIAEPGPDEVLVRIEAAPINPSDVGLLLAFADVGSVKVRGVGEARAVEAVIPGRFIPLLAARMGQSLPAGNEGAGVVIKAGSSEQARALLGKTVAVLGGAMYAQYRTVKVADVLPLPAGAAPADGASCFINPLTSLCMVETMRREGHTALVNTAAASNLGQMLNRICMKDGIGLVNIVRSAEQAKLLREMGALHVCNSNDSQFTDQLTQALVETGATVAFDAVGGGKLADQILSCMEAAANRQTAQYSRYGSTTYKQVYIYGGLDLGPTELTRAFGFAWGVGGWLLRPFLATLSAVERQRLQARVVAEIKTTFASHYTRVISLAQALEPDVIAAYARRATGQKYLINPNGSAAAAWTAEGR